MDTAPYRTGVCRLVCLCMFVAFFSCKLVCGSVDTDVRYFDVREGKARITLKKAAHQAEVDFIFSPRVVIGETTRAIKGEFAPLEAFALMLADTALSVFQHEESGVFGIRKIATNQEVNYSESPSQNQLELNNKHMKEIPQKSRNIVRAILAFAMSSGAASNAVAQDDEEDVFELSPFTVDATDANGYRATSTLAGTRIKTNLRDVGSSVSVMTEEFLQDTNSNNTEDLLVYAVSSEVAGQGGNFVGQGDGPELDTTDRREPVQNTRVRGLAEADNTRNFYLSDIPWDSYNVTRIDLQRGPNSILFGIGSPAGIINAGLQSAAMADSNEVGIQLGSNGSTRFTGNFNKVLIEDELAVRIALLDDNTEYKQDPAFKDDTRIYAAFTWKPKGMNTDTHTTEISLNYENGEIDSNNPRITPPNDAITPWFTDLNQISILGPEANSVTNPWIGSPGNRVFDGVVTPFVGTTQGDSYVTGIFAFPNAEGGIGDNTGAEIWGIRNFNRYASPAGLPGAGIGAYKAKSLTDPTIFDFYNNLLEGPNKGEFNDFDALSIAFRQSFFGNKAGYEIAHDKQDAEWGYVNYFSGDSSQISVDIMRSLMDGSNNPNFGRPFALSGGGGSGGFLAFREREVTRATVFTEIDFTDNRSESLSRILGKHTLTGLISRNEINYEDRNYLRNFTGDSYAPNNSNAVGQASRDVIVYNYLGDSLENASSASGANIPRIQDVTIPQSTTIMRYNNVTDEFEMVPLEIVNADLFSDFDRPYRNGSMTFQKIDSIAAVWQGSMFDGLVIPMVGWREDESTGRSAGGPPANGVTNGIVNVNDPTWVLGTANVETGNSITKSLVVHMPQYFREKTGFDLSFHYNESENFQPDSSRVGILGNTLASPSGETEEYGFTISGFNDKVILKYTEYDTKVFNASAGEVGGQYLIGAVEAWGRRAALAARDGTWEFGEVFGIATGGGEVRYRPDRALEDGESYTQQELDDVYAIQEAAINAWLADPVPQAFQDAWALGDYENGEAVTNFGPSGLEVTADTLSKGTEIELIANPMDNLTIAVNFSDTSASRTNLASTYIDWVESRFADFTDTPQGDIRLWSPLNDLLPPGENETARGKYSRETIAGLAFWQALDGSDVPELVKKRYSLVANYKVLDGKFAGLNFGGSFRSADAPTVGFPVLPNGEGGFTYDLANPIKGDREENFDFWAGYKMNLNDKVEWKVQLNVRNAFGGDDLYAVTRQPNGDGGTFRIGAPTTWTLRNTFSF